jgi:branched-chain amino acid transport system ATP-binding protein
MSDSLLLCTGATKAFGGLVAVNGVTLELDEGEILGLIGPNGAGKTTLFNIISGEIPPDEGAIHFNGGDITGLKPHVIAQRGLVRTFQIVKPFAKLSVVENVMVGAFINTSSVEKAERRARELIEFVGLGSHADLPASNLTTASRKRLELARALATRPRLLLLDEVMAGLTPTESASMVELLQEIREQGVTQLVIEHVMQAVMTLSDRIAVLHHGELIGVGRPAQIASDSRVIEAYLGEEFEIAEN